MDAAQNPRGADSGPGAVVDWRSFSTTAGGLFIAQLSYASTIGGLLIFYCGSFVFGKFIFIGPVFFSLMDITYILIDGVTVVPFFIIVLLMGGFLQFPFVTFTTNRIDKFVNNRFSRSAFVRLTIYILVLMAAIALLSAALMVYVDSVGLFPSMLIFSGSVLAAIVLFVFKNTRKVPAFTVRWFRNVAIMIFCGLFAPSLMLIAMGYLDVMNNVRKYEDSQNYMSLYGSDKKLLPLVFSKDYLFVFDGQKFVILKSDVLVSASIIRDYKGELPTGAFDSFLERLVKQELEDG
jgi:hypothetical protein